MWMLSVDNWLSEGCLTLLEQQRIAALRHGRRLEAQHCACCENTVPQRSLRHTHKPVRREKFVAAARTRLLLVDHEYIRVEHQHPRSFRRHEHGDGRGIRFG